MAGVELGQHLVPGAPPSVYYVPDFITQVLNTCNSVESIVP